MKIYAKQVPPEWQESPLFIDGCFPEDVILDGNKDYISHTTEEYDNLFARMDDLSYELDKLETGEGWYKNATEAISDILPRHDGKPYNTRQVHAWRRIIDEWDYRGNDDLICEALHLMTGKEYQAVTICGCCQSDWQDAYFPADWSRDDIAHFESEYFNTGSEWIIHDEATEPAGPDDVSGYSLYCTSWNNDGIKQEIADCVGGSPEDVIIYPFEQYQKVPVWGCAQ